MNTLPTAEPIRPHTLDTEHVCKLLQLNMPFPARREILMCAKRSDLRDLGQHGSDEALDVLTFAAQSVRNGCGPLNVAVARHIEYADRQGFDFGVELSALVH